ncbi:hypothetical protein VKT23_015540 [Stygiomarasmius scandens]|uniref:Uncharacterized protein n=1 Tax=Marasmiellus scandens TaxID=2682957 RepID=A0ABR1IZR3_9AGAR
MASWSDIIALLITVAVFGGITVGVLALVRTFSEGVKSTKEKLKERGVDVSKGGVSVKTSKRFDHERYVDATQRGIIRAMGASSIGGSSQIPQSPPTSAGSATLSPPVIQRTTSSSSIGSTGSSSGSGKRSFFKRRKD